MIELIIFFSNVIRNIEKITAKVVIKMLHIILKNFKVHNVLKTIINKKFQKIY